MKSPYERMQNYFNSLHDFNSIYYRPFKYGRTVYLKKAKMIAIKSEIQKISTWLI